MATITVRNLPEKVVSALKARAKGNGNSMEQEVREILEVHALDRAEILRRIEKDIWPRLRRSVRADEIHRWTEERWRHRP